MVAGVQAWLIQRITAIILALYVLFLLGYWVSHPAFSYANWQALFDGNLMRYSSLMALFSLITHAWIGLWTITTDYLKVFLVRFLIQLVLMAALLGYFFWGIHIIWRL